MTQLLVYSLKASLTLALCYVPYMLILRHERFFRLNRFVLLGILVLSLLLPLFNISVLSIDRTPVMQATYQQMADAGLPVQSIDIEAMPSADMQPMADAQPAGIHWFDIIAIVFFVGMVVSILLRCIQMGVLSYILSRRNVWTRRREDGILVCCRRGKFSPYSWMNRIVISENDWDENAETILLHETGHIRARHSLDQLLLLVSQAVMWYNPFAWLLGYSLADVHEYEADDYVLRQGVDAKSYMMMLVMKVAKWEGYSFVNSLNHSTLNKRILMMKTPADASNLRLGKTLYLLPVCAFALSIFATPKLGEPAQKALLELEHAQEPVTYTLHPDIAPAFGQSETDFYVFMAKYMRYPQLAQQLGVTGRIWVDFIVNPDGSLQDIKSLPDNDGKPDGMSTINEIGVISYDRNHGRQTEEESHVYQQAMQELMDEAIRVIEASSGQWTPGYMLQQDGTQKAVPVKLTFPISFRLR